MAQPPLQNESFDALQKSLKTALISTTRTTSALCAEDLPFQRSLDSDFARDLDAQHARLLSLAETLLKVAEPTPNANSKGGDRVRAPKLGDAEELDAKWREVVDVVDSLLERTDGVLDEVKGLLRKGAAAGGGVAETEKPVTASPAPTPKNKKSFQHAANILKPQRTFEHPPNNFATGPWKPLLTRKPHAKIPLEESLRTEQSTDGTARQMYGDTTSTFHSALERSFNASFYLQHYKTLSPQMKQLVNTHIRYRHPYQTEIEEYRYPPSMYEKREPVMYQPYEETTATYVDTEEAVEEMLEELKKAKEIAIDLEHHDQRTYVGIVCLMQISTRDRDWIVDTLKPWRRRLECLNEVFADPNILKVLHGSAMDVIWLQRDLGLYLVGVFDTEHAATALHYPKRSLAFLLEKWVNFQAQKQYQLADWRVRPLTKELFDYARSDTHFLLYIYDCMRNQLIENSHDGEDGDLLDRVLRESKRYGLQRYETPFYDAENGLGSMGWYKTLFRTPALLSKQQFAVFKAVHQWRDNTARAEDESLPFVMSQHLLQTLSREMPTSKEEVLAATPPYANLVRQNVEGLCMVIADAKARGAVEGVEMRDAMARSDALADEQHNNKVAARWEALRKTKQEKQQQREDKDEAQLDKTIDDVRKPATVDVAAVKADGSAFWGSTLNGIEARPATIDTSTVRLALPMPETSGDIFAPTNGISTPIKPEPPTQSTASTPMDAPSPQSDSDIFVLRDKQRGGKKHRKRKIEEVAEDELKAGAEVVGLDVGGDDGGDGHREERRRKKRERREREAERNAEGFLEALGAPPPPSSKTKDTPSSPKAKVKKDKAKKDHPPATSFMAALHGSTSSTAAQPDEVAEEEAPFDYANAPSILQPADDAGRKRKKDQKKAGKKGRMEGVDPYKKATDAPKGLPRGQRERVGEAGTFAR